MTQSNSDDLDDVMRLEKGRKRYKTRSKEDVAKHQQWKKECKNILLAMNWEEVVTALGLLVGTKEYDDWRKTWTAYHGALSAGGLRLQKPKPRKP